jgi:hypothetical protein
MRTGNETDILKAVNRAIGCAYAAVRLSSASLAECNICRSRTSREISYRWLGLECSIRKAREKHGLPAC